MHPRIAEYLSLLGRHIRPRRLEARIRDEIAAHILDIVEAKQGAGASEEEAIGEALARLGDPAELGRSLSRANRPWYLRWFFLLPSSLALAGLGAALGVNFLVEQELGEIHESYAKDKEIFQLFLADQKYLAQFDFLKPPGQERDAGEFFNTRVSWEGSAVAERFRHPPLAIEPKIAEQIGQKFLPIWDKVHSSPFPRWLAVPDQPLFHKVDLSWMRELGRYDHWDLFVSEGPAADAIKRGVSPYAIPAPNTSELKLYAQLRYLRGIYEKRPLAALKEVRQMVLLLHSTETLVGMMVAYGILRLERQYYEEMVRQKLLRPGDWKAISQRDLDLARRASWASAEWVSFFAPPEMTGQMLASHQPILGLCAGIYENAIGGAYAANYFRPRVWGETDFQARFAQLERLLERNPNHCRLSYAKFLFHSGYAMDLKVEDIYMGKENWESLLWVYSQYVPFLRRLIGAKFAMIAQPGWAEIYKRKLASSNSP